MKFILAILLFGSSALADVGVVTCETAGPAWMTVSLNLERDQYNDDNGPGGYYLIMSTLPGDDSTEVSIRAGASGSGIFRTVQHINLDSSPRNIVNQWVGDLHLHCWVR